MLTRDTRVILGIPWFNKGVIILRIWGSLFSKLNVIQGIPGITLVSLLSIPRINTTNTKDFLVCLLKILGLLLGIPWFTLRYENIRKKGTVLQLKKNHFTTNHS